ncbi:hypothetical protein [Aestuariivita boseongensis]|uniref:hypothetical protein n=1 Tax=Aestuariivita boseongensis TaxID=1470562 RepID=UPI0012F8C83B|nr:hypothetical protein [Aestuariivita boseongensis]
MQDRLKPFAAHLYLSTPFAGDSVPTLDAVLAAEIALASGEAFPDYPDELPLAYTEEGVPHASQGFFLGEQTVTEQQLFSSHSRNWDENKRSADRFVSWPAPTTDIGKGCGAGGKNVGYVVRTRAVELIEYRGVGEIELVRAILEGTPAVGQHRNKGMGAIEKVDVFGVDEDPETWALVQNGQPLRPIPVRSWKGGPAAIAMQRWRVPYWDTSVEPELCVVPSTQDLLSL